MRPTGVPFHYNRAALGSAGDLTGALIADKYELLRLIGRGGMGAVYEARNVATFKRCAVKVLLSPELAGDEEVVRRFFREARASGLIESEHVVAAFDSGIDSAERAYYVMECLQGEDLEQTLERVGQLCPHAAIKIVLQAAAGLASAHALGIVHRDVKPANLFLALGPGTEVRVKILDFGVAKVKMEVFNESSNTLTHSGSLLGTPIYMSPEQLRRASDIDDSADVWSLGVVLFECLTGQLPWGECDGIGELVTAILTQRVPHVQDLAPWVQPNLAEIVQRALSRDPARRLRSAAELHDAMQQLLGADKRLYAHELIVPDEQERRSRAPRLSMPDTVMVGPSPSTVPVVTGSSAAPRRNRSLVTAVAAATALAGAGAWTWGPHLHAQRASSADVTFLAKPLATEQVPIAAPPPAAPVEASPAPQRLMLAVAPSTARVELNGVVVTPTAGQVLIEGTIGSEHVVQLTVAGSTFSRRVQIAPTGLVPKRVVFPPPSPAKLAPETRPAMDAVLVPTVEAPASPEITPVFE
jgi:eukaryotic-like serine/threonine-protein kinase